MIATPALCRRGHSYRWSAGAEGGTGLRLMRHCGLTDTGNCVPLQLFDLPPTFAEFLALPREAIDTAGTGRCRVAVGDPELGPRRRP